MKNNSEARLVKMNSSFCLVETPKKKFISVKSQVIPSSLNHSDRFSPSKFILNLLNNAARIHSFQFHIEVNFTDLCEMTFLNRKLVKSLNDYFTTEAPDIPDMILKLETFAVEIAYYGPFLKEYIAEEFSIPSEYSFSVVAILNYLHLFNISVEDALRDIFKVSSR